jgi:hypothetical protein
VKITRRSFVPADKCATVHSKQRIQKASDEKIKDRWYHSTVYSTTCVYMVSTVVSRHSVGSSCWSIHVQCTMSRAVGTEKGRATAVPVSILHVHLVEYFDHIGAAAGPNWQTTCTAQCRAIPSVRASQQHICITTPQWFFFSFVLRWTLHSLENWNIPSIERINWHIHQDSV